MLSCPACHTLVHADQLKALAAAAEKATAAEDLLTASQSWQQALDLLPPTSRQYAAIAERVTEITKKLAERPQGETPATPSGPWWKRGSTAAAALGILLLSKLKFLLLGLTKLKTFISMFAFFGVYWTAYGWPLAAGLVLSIYIHEMGHVAELKRLGIAASAPLFIPGLGALVLMKRHITDPAVDARVGLAGPVWGLGAGVIAYVVYLVTGVGIWGAIAALTGFINLLNLTPIWQLDGSRGFHALSQLQRWIAVAVIAAAFAVTSQPILLLVGAVALYRAFQRPNTPHNWSALGTYVVLVSALALLTKVHSVG